MKLRFLRDRAAQVSLAFVQHSCGATRPGITLRCAVVARCQTPPGQHCQRAVLYSTRQEHQTRLLLWLLCRLREPRVFSAWVARYLLAPGVAKLFCLAAIGGFISRHPLCLFVSGTAARTLPDKPSCTCLHASCWHTRCCIITGSSLGTHVLHLHYAALSTARLARWHTGN